MLTVLNNNRSPSKCSKIYNPEAAGQIRRLECRWYNECLVVADSNKWAGFTCRQCNGFQRLTQEELERDNEGILKVFAAWAQMEREIHFEEQSREAALLPADGTDEEDSVDEEDREDFTKYATSQEDDLLEEDEEEQSLAGEEDVDIDFTAEDAPTGPRWYEKADLGTVKKRPSVSVGVVDIDFTKPPKPSTVTNATVAAVVATVSTSSLGTDIKIETVTVQAPEVQQVKSADADDVISIEDVDKILQERRSRKSKTCVVDDGDCIRLI